VRADDVASSSCPALGYGGAGALDIGPRRGAYDGLRVGSGGGTWRSAAGGVPRNTYGTLAEPSGAVVLAMDFAQRAPHGRVLHIANNVSTHRC
jgi:hypothetical protein